MLGYMHKISSTLSGVHDRGYGAVDQLGAIGSTERPERLEPPVQQRLFDPSITPYAVLAFLGWLAAAALVVIDAFLPDDYLGHLGIICAAASATLNVRGFIHQRECRDKVIFDLGRESGLRVMR